MATASATSATRRPDRAARRGAALALIALLGAGCGLGGRRSPHEAPARAQAPEGSVQLQSFDYVYDRITAVHPEPEALGDAWAARYAALRPKAAAAKDEDAVADVILELLGGLPGAHHALIRRDGRRLAVVGEPLRVPVAPPSAPVVAAARRAPPPRPAAPAPPLPPRPFAPGEQAYPGMVTALFQGDVRVAWIEPGGPAAAAGVKLGDQITAVDGEPCARSTAACIGLARPPGAEIALELSGSPGRSLRLSPSQPRSVTTAAIGASPGMQTLSASARAPLSSGGHAEVLVLSAMSMGAVQLINARLPRLQAEGARGLVIDLRGNPGGLIVSAAGLAGYLIDAPTSLGSMNTRQDALQIMAYPRPAGQRFSGRVAVLIDAGSASTSEVIAGALQELGLARVFGERSRGAVETSSIEPLPNGDRVQLVIATVRTPKGAPLEGAGVRPDVAVPGASSRGASGQDRALDAALAWIDAD